MLNATPTKDTAPKGKPGRKSETPAQRLERLERETELARQAVADLEQTKLATIGRAVVAEAEGDAAFMERLRSVLRSRVTGKAGKAAVATLLDHAGSEAAAG